MFKASAQTYLFAFLVFCVLSSKSIIIYNEETLITCSFVLFVFFVFHYFGNTIQESLDERKEGIKVECQNFRVLQQQSLEELAAEHEKISELQNALSQLMHFTKKTLLQHSKTGVQSLKNNFSQQMVEKCSELRGGKSGDRLQSFMARNAAALVLVHCAKQGMEIHENSNHLPHRVLNSALQLFISAAKKK